MTATRKKLDFKRFILVLVMILAVAMPVVAFAQNEIGREFVEDRGYISQDQSMFTLPQEEFMVMALTRRDEGVDIRGLVPIVPSHFMGQEYLNANIEAVVSRMIVEARRVRARSVHFSHEIHQTESTVSVVIYANIATSINRTMVRSINFNRATGYMINANEAAGMDIISLARLIISERVRRDPARYYAAMSVDMNRQAFIMTTEGVVFLFDEFQLSTTQSGISSIFLSRQNIRTAIVRNDQYHMRQDHYNLQMIPLRYVLDQQPGYRVEYFSEPQGMVVYVWRDDQVITRLRPGSNEYELHGNIIRSIEGTPQIANGAVYVPITFFDQILPLTVYSIDARGTIIFLSYLG